MGDVAPFVAPASSAIHALDRRQPSRPAIGNRLLQQAKELVAVDPGVGENAAQRPALQILGVHRDRDDVPVVGVDDGGCPWSGRASSPSVREPGSAVGGEPTEAARSRGDGDPLDLRRQGQRAPLPLQHLEVVSTCYGRRAPTIVNNHAAKVFGIGISDTGTLD